MNRNENAKTKLHTPHNTTKELFPGPPTTGTREAMALPLFCKLCLSEIC